VYFTKMIKDSPELTSLKVRQAELSMELGDHQFAQIIWETLLSEGSESTDYLDGYISALTAMGKEAEILPRLSELIKSDQARVSRMLNLAQRFYYSGDTE